MSDFLSAANETSSQKEEKTKENERAFQTKKNMLSLIYSLFYFQPKKTKKLHFTLLEKESFLTHFIFASMRSILSSIS